MSADVDDSGLTAWSGDDGLVWRWYWRGGRSEAVSPQTFPTEAAALAAGRRWLHERAE
jgi:hypothetical protein